MKRSSIILLLVSIAWIIIDLILQDDLFEWNHHVALWFQNSETSPSSFRFMIFRIISILGYQEAVGPFMVIGYFFFANKIQGLKVILTTVFSSYILSLLKMFYHEPRPYFVFIDLQGIGCDREFGKPSGHAMVSVIIYFLLFDSFINKKYTKLEQKPEQNVELTDIVIIQNASMEIPSISNRQKNNSDVDGATDEFLSNKIYFGTYLALIFLIGLSRVVLGVHSFGQVLLGWAYGIIFMVIYREKADKILETILITITLKQFNNFQQLKNYSIKLLTCYFCFVVLAVATFAGIDNSISDETKQKYANNIMSKTYCTSVKIDSHSFLTKKCLLDSAVISIIFSVLLTTIFSNGLYQPENWSLMYSSLSIVKKILRLIVQGICAFIPVGASLFFILDNIYLAFFLKSSFIYFLAGFGLIKVSPWALRVLRLDVGGDFLKNQPEYGFFESVKTRFFDPMRQK